MKYNELTISTHATSKRRGRGIASGKGKTAGRGTKGQGARTGSTRRPGFAGGQNPLMQQLPKLPGFTNHRAKGATVYIGDLEQFSGKTVDAYVLAENGLVPSPYVRIKVIVGRTELTKKLEVKLQAISAKALEQLQKAGGNFEAVAREQRSKTKKPKS